MLCLFGGVEGGVILLGFEMGFGFGFGFCWIVVGRDPSGAFLSSRIRD